jgi:hypothetical protein
MSKGLYELILDDLFDKQSKCSHCGKSDCGHTNRTLFDKLDVDIVLEILNKHLIESLEQGSEK